MDPATHYRGRVAEEYEDRRRDQPEWRAEAEAVRRWLEDIPPGSVVLDVPVGTGRFLKLYHELGLFCVGVDISADMLKQADVKDTFAFLLQGDATDLPPGVPCADVAVCVRFVNWVSPEGLRGTLRGLRRRVSRMLVGAMTSEAVPVVRGGATTFSEECFRQALAAAGLVESQRFVITEGDGYVYALRELRT